MKNSYQYSVQMASIKKGDWRLQEYIDKGYGPIRLLLENRRLWRTVKKIVDGSPMPPGTHVMFPGSKLIGYGWEWAVYKLPHKKEVVKIPAGIFREVNEPDYLENTKYAYRVCRKYLDKFVVESTFERRRFKSKYVNLVFQRKFPSKQYQSIKPKSINKKLKKNLIKLAEGMLAILEDLDWMPDMNLRKDMLKNNWGVWNLIVKDNEPKIFDFTSYHDVFRHYPLRTKLEVKLKGNKWRRFIKELKKE